MPSFTRLAIAALPLAATVSAYTPVFNSAWGNAIIKNECKVDVYFWEDKGEYGAPMKTILAGNRYEEKMFQTGKDNGAGPSFKITVAPPGGGDPSISGPITQFEYTVAAPEAGAANDKQVFFDISNVNAQGSPPFSDGGVLLTSPQDSKATKFCPANVVTCSQVYNSPTDDKQSMVNTDMGNDIMVVLCHGSGSDSDSGSGSGSGPAPSSSSAAPPASSSSAAPPPPPAVEEKKKADPKPTPTPTSTPEQQSTKVVVVTEYAQAAVVTVHVQAPEKRSEEQKEKREEHIHAHAHAHQKINKRRHGA